ncbi:MAG: transketolase [Rhodospirillales bacterium]|nr:MAG: transketolase [Rhodospirillales bacterium]
MSKIDLDERSLTLRRRLIDTLVAAGRGHPGPGLSLVEILRVLYDDVLRLKPSEPLWEGRDRLILSKGHGCLALYVMLADKGFIDPETLKTFCRYDSPLGGHPEFGPVPGVEASTGALGHGLSIGVGQALGLRLKGIDARVFVVMGDGELNEGSVWEAAMAAPKHRLDRLVAVVDRNSLQSYGPTAGVLDMEPLAEKWQSFGWAAEEVDGHDVAALIDVFARLPLKEGKPTVVICKTVKGCGIPEAENNPDWHHKNKLSEAEMEAIARALEVVKHA